MRDYIFDFEQKRMVDLKLSLKEVLIIFYLKQFFDSGNAVYKVLDDKRYYLIRYDKIISDLPILGVNRRQLARLIEGLENKGIIKKFLYNRVHLYLWINDEKLYFDDEDSQKCLSLEDRNDIFGIPNSQKCPTIVKYYKNRVKILYKDNARVLELGADNFLNSLKRSLSRRMNKLYYQNSVKLAEVEVVTLNMIVLSLPHTNLFKFCKPNTFENAVNLIFRRYFILD